MNENGKGKKELIPLEKLELRLRQFKGRVVLAYIAVGEDDQVKVASLQDQGKAEWFVKTERRDGRG